MALKAFKSTISKEFWTEIEEMNAKSLSIQKIVDTMTEKHNQKFGFHSVRKLCKYFTFKEVEDIPTISQKATSTDSTKDSPNRKNYIDWVINRLLDVAKESFEHKKYELFFKASDRLIAIHRIEKPLEVITSNVAIDHGKDAFKQELLDLIKPKPPRIPGTSD